MRFHCFYQTSENENRDEWISARDRDDAYAKLKARGIRPYRLEGKNPRHFSLWVFAVLGLLPAALILLLLLQAFKPPTSNFQPPTSPLSHPRAQIYGDSAILQACDRAGWTNVFTSAGDAWLACHARPGISCDCVSKPPTSNLQLQTSLLPLSPSDPEEYVKMKRMVNGMKEELAAYLAAGGTETDYRALCCERIRTEEGVAQRIAEEFDRLRADSEKMTREAVISEWEKKNVVLRALGLPTVLLPAELL